MLPCANLFISMTWRNLVTLIVSEYIKVECYAGRHVIGKVLEQCLRRKLE